ncbi:MAG: hypothetical protein MI802_19130 [Desulfobacterales bacterium]|nr:hypothetical protein [Desulfobacterales bacterium]
MLHRFLISLMIVLGCLAATAVSAHTLYMNLVNNDDGTVTVEAMFSTGSSGAGLPVYLVDGSQTIIQKLKLDENGEVTFDIPDQPYTVFLDGGPGHTVRKEGPAMP